MRKDAMVNRKSVCLANCSPRRLLLPVGEFFVNIDTDMLKIIDSKNGSSLHYNAENQTYIYI